MKQGRMILGLALAAVLAVATAGTAPAATRKAAVASVTKPRAAALHQFCGVVTALDASSLTVEKRGNGAKTMVFSRHAGMRTTGELQKDARVTVWYRDEDGRSVARKVVVKPDADTAGH
jgi:hypothetical protein